MNTFELERKSDIFGSCRIFRIKHIGKPVGFNLIQYPFSNCQTFSIAPFQTVFFGGTGYEEATDRIKEIRSLGGITQKLCHVDIRWEIFEKIKDYINVYSKMEYTNLTGSKMVNLLIKI